MHFILNQTTVTDNNLTKLCIKSPNCFHCLWHRHLFLVTKIYLDTIYTIQVYFFGIYSIQVYFFYQKQVPVACGLYLDSIHHRNFSGILKWQYIYMIWFNIISEINIYEKFQLQNLTNIMNLILNISCHSQPMKQAVSCIRHEFKQGGDINWFIIFFICSCLF